MADLVTAIPAADPVPVPEPAVPALPVVLDPATEPVFQFICGVAGTGKTTLIRNRVHDHTDAILMATTGIAAVNLGPEATTINSQLIFYETADLQQAYEVGRLNAFLNRFARSGYSRLIVDEISMMDAGQLTILVTAIEDYNRWADDNSRPRLGLTIVGDFFQLPPVKAPFVFESPVWDRFEPSDAQPDATIVLKKIWRQDNPDFITALHAVRRGDRKTAVDYFASRLVPQDHRFDGTTIFGKNDEVDRHNRLRLLQLIAKPDFYPTTREGKQAGDWKHIPDTLELKAGCLVMILANRRYPKEDPSDPPPPMMYANGDLAHYLGRASEHAARVKLLRNGQEVTVVEVVKEKSQPTGKKGKETDSDGKTTGEPDEKVRRSVEGWVRYLPLRVAYATTCHKTQSLTLDRVQVVFHSQFWQQPGMLYTALSRARTPEGLFLVGTPMQLGARITVNPKLSRWA